MEKKGMTQEELLKPRYKVIADYPLGVYTIGEVLQPEYDNTMGVVEGGYFKTDLSKYPAIFQPLEWYEERKSEDLPPYVKTTHKNFQVIKVWKWEDGIIKFEKGGGLLASYIMPATEQEYNDYQSPPTP